MSEVNDLMKKLQTVSTKEIVEAVEKAEDKPTATMEVDAEVDVDPEEHSMEDGEKKPDKKKQDTMTVVPDKELQQLCDTKTNEAIYDTETEEFSDNEETDYQDVRMIPNIEVLTGTGRRGEMPAETTYDDIVDVFGEPNINTEDHDKIQALWGGQINGSTFSIYDWKSGKNAHDLVGDDWHIGGAKGGRVVQDVIDYYQTGGSSGDMLESKINEAVHELVGETPGIGVFDQKILNWAIDNDIIPNQFPTYSLMMGALKKLPGATEMSLEDAFKEVGSKGFADKADVQGMYLKDVLLPIAVNNFKNTYSEDKPWFESKQLHICNDCDKTFRNTITECTYCKSANVTIISVDEDEAIITEGYNHEILGAERLDSFGGYSVGSKFKIGAKHYRLLDINKTNTHTILTARDLSTGEIDDHYFQISKNESLDDEDKFKTVAKGIDDEETAKKLALDKRGIVIQDDENDANNKKLAVIVKEAVKDVRLSIDGDETVIGMHDSYIIAEALRVYLKKEIGDSDIRDAKQLYSMFHRLAWQDDDRSNESVSEDKYDPSTNIKSMLVEMFFDKGFSLQEEEREVFGIHYTFVKGDTIIKVGVDYPDNTEEVKIN